MDTRNGQLIPLSRRENLPEEDKKFFIEVKRDLTLLEQQTLQIKLYSPCGCGSGKKFKFCCYKS